jgi:hypothetical protein
MEQEEYGVAFYKGSEGCADFTTFKSFTEAQNFWDLVADSYNYGVMCYFDGNHLEFIWAFGKDFTECQLKCYLPLFKYFKK